MMPFRLLRAQDSRFIEWSIYLMSSIQYVLLLDSFKICPELVHERTEN